MKMEKEVKIFCSYFRLDYTKIFSTSLNKTLSPNMAQHTIQIGRRSKPNSVSQSISIKKQVKLQERLQAKSTIKGKKIKQN